MTDDSKDTKVYGFLSIYNGIDAEHLEYYTPKEQASGLQFDDGVRPAGKVSGPQIIALPRYNVTARSDKQSAIPMNVYNRKPVAEKVTQVPQKMPPLKAGMVKPATPAEK
eukprot:GEMP01069816.1.p1 GENE.GEMP01069816.1~~GEMP01069816.1.p1  ORF type:complete len:110 (+),score=17.56 GEMP01069816.1:67-396(+)